MILKDIIKDINIKSFVGNIDIDINGIAYDSRKIQKGYLFICVKGFNTDGHKYIQDAIKNGAVAVIVEEDISTQITKIVVYDTRKVMSEIAARFYDFPTTKMNLVGVTGTNGKTTTTYLIKSILEKTNKRVGLLGTISIKIGDKTIQSSRTTPEAIDLQGLFNDMIKSDVSDAVMEVSSHSLELNRVDNCRFTIGIFTNLTQDHLDFHNTIENYRNAKKKLFEKTTLANIINIDDEHGKIIANEISNLDVRLITYAIDSYADIMAKNISVTSRGASFILVTPDYKIPITINTPGKFSVYNALAAAACAYAKGIDKEVIKEGLISVDGVPGRAEVVQVERPYTVIVDYAHTPDGLRNILNSIRQYANARLITVFGCGGDRDRTKRPIMGEIAGQISDVCIVTSDNPRSEDPIQIIKQVEQGILKTNCECFCIENRKDAISYALSIAKEDDVILIAGKGHETYQELNGYTIPFDDREVVFDIVDCKTK